MQTHVTLKELNKRKPRFSAWLLWQLWAQEVVSLCAPLNVRTCFWRGDRRSPCRSPPRPGLKHQSAPGGLWESVRQASCPTVAWRSLPGAPNRIWEVCASLQGHSRMSGCRRDLNILDRICRPSHICHMCSGWTEQICQFERVLVNANQAAWCWAVSTGPTGGCRALKPPSWSQLLTVWPPACKCP